MPLVTGSVCGCVTASVSVQDYMLGCGESGCVWSCVCECAAASVSVWVAVPMRVFLCTWLSLCRGGVCVAGCVP